MALPASPVAAVDTAVSIVPTNTQVHENNDFIVSINVDSVSDFDAAQYDITFDPGVIQVTEVTAGNIGGTSIPVGMWTSIDSDTIRVINNILDVPGITGSGYLAEIHFHVVGASGSSSPISLTSGLLGNTNAAPIPATWPPPASVSIVATVTADFSANVTEVLVNQSITFTANPTGGSGSYLYAWDFGDTGISTMANPTHSYASPGNYTVALTVTDTADGSNTNTKTNYISVYAALMAGASASVTEAAVGQTVTFSSATTTGGKVGSGYSCEWDFKDGGTSTVASPTHSYSTSGTYIVSLEVTDGLGNTSSTTVTVTVYKRGDADKDGTVQALDITYIENVIMEKAGYIPTTWADANNDGKWDVLDLTAVELIILQP